MKRRFADLSWGQVHYRIGGDGDVPLVMLHGGAANGASLLPAASLIATTRMVLVPDLPGCGDSDPLPMPQPEIADLADALVALLDALELARVDIHGAHLGARVAVEAALRHPSRVRRVILDGVGFYDEAARQAMLTQVAPPIVPDAEGDYLHAAFGMCRAYFRYFPWFERDAAHRRAGPAPTAGAIHAKLLEVLRNGSTYARAYHAALRYRMEDRLPLLRTPALLAFARTDNVFAQRHRAAALLPSATLAETPGSADIATTAAIFTRFLNAEPYPQRGEEP
jgi:pimeloyl-ACP methyl ester carboxylesterase